MQAGIDAKNELDSALYKSKQSFNEHKDKVDQATQDEILAAFNEAEKALNGDNVEAMTTAKGNVEKAAMKIGQAIYNQSSANNNAKAEETKTEETKTEGESENKENKENK